MGILFIPNQVSASQAYEAKRTIRSTPGTLLGLSGYNSKGSAQFIQLHDATAKPAAEVFTINMTGLTGATAKGKYITFADSAGSVYLWGNDGVVSDPAPSGYARGIAYTITGDADDAATLAAAIATAVDADSKFACTALSATATVTNSETGTRTNASAGNSGATVATTTQGVGYGTGPIAVITAATVANFAFNIPAGGIPFHDGIYVTNSSTGPTLTEGSADCYFTAIFK